MQIAICRKRDIKMQQNGINERKLEKVREESFSFKRRIICNWTLLKERLTPVEVIDLFISNELVAADLWDYIKNKSRRYQMDSMLTSVVKNVETSDDYDKFETIVTAHKIQLNTPRDELFIAEQRKLVDRTWFRENRELVEKELYPKDHIDSFLEWFILSPEDHEALRNKENVRKQMANSFLQNIMKPISIEKGSMACLLESFQKDQNRILMHLVKLMDARFSYFIGDQELQLLIEKRDACRNSIMSKWTYLKENFYPHKNLIDELCSSGLIDDDRAESINEQPRGEQVYLILRNIVRRIDGPERFSKFISLLDKESSFISEKLKETSHKSVRSIFIGEKYCFCRNPYKLEDKAFRDKLHQLFNVYKDDIARELYPTDVDTFMDKLVFDVDDHEIICEAGNDENKKAWKFYEMIADTKYIQKGSFDCLIFCLRNNEKLKKSRQILADILFSIIIPKQVVKNRTGIASKTTDGVIYTENTSHFTEGELKMTVDDLSKDELEHEIFKVVNSSEYQGKEIDGLKLNVQEAKRSSVVVHLQSNGENVKLVVEKGIVEGDLSSFIRNLLDDENIKMHMIQGHKYKVSVSLHSKNQHKLFSGVQGSHKMRIIKANRELLEEEYDPLPLLKSVFDENAKKYKSVTDLSPQYVTAVFNQFKGISEVPERRKRVKQFMDIAEYMIDADTLWKLIEDTANAFSVKKLRDDLHGVNSGQENIKSSAAYLKDGLVFKGSYEVWITEEDVFSPLQSMILETNQKQDVKQSMILETNQKQEEEIKHLEGTHFTKGCGEVLQTSVDQLSCDVRDVLNIGEIVSHTASNVTVIKDLVESGNLASHTQNRSRVTDVLQEDSRENFQVPSNLFEHHVTHDYKCTKNDVKLQEVLEKHNCVTVKGYIGTGKSQLALNYGLHMKKDNNLVWKFNCSNIQELWRSTAYLLKELRYKIKDTENKKDDILFMAKTINEYLEKNHTRFHIFIFEDVVGDSRNIIETFINVYLAKRGNLEVLVTSSLSVTEIELEIDGFSEEEAILFIDAIEATNTEREELVKTFSCNPLGLNIALRYIKHCQISVGAFLGKLSFPKGALEIEDSPAISQRCELKPLFQSLHLILSDIHKNNPSTLQRILLMQFLGSDNIPVIMLQNVYLNFGSKELKEGGICNSSSDTIDDVISTLKQYSFARISGIDDGKDDTRVLHTHSAILLAIKNYTSEAVESNDITVADMLKALLWTVVCLMNKDNRMKADLQRHTYLLPYAESILNSTRTLLGNTEEAKTKLFLDISFSLPLVYVSDIVGYTYDFDEMFHDGEAYYKVAESYLIKMVGISVPFFCATDEDIQIKSKEAAAHLHRKMNNIYKQNTKMLNTIGQWYILNRSEEELEIIQKGLHRVGKTLNRKFRNEQDLDLLHENKLAVPKKKIGYFFFFEVVISFLYSYGRRLFLTLPSDIRHNCYFLHIADHLSNIVHELNPKWKMIHHLLTKRSGTLQVALKEISGLPQTDMKNLKEIVKQCLRSLDERNTYFRFGIIYLETESDEFNKVIWLKQLVRCYQTMLRKAKDETENEEIKQQGQEHVNHLERLIKAFEHTSALPSLLLCIGEFYQCIRDFQRAKTTFKKVFPKLTQAEQKVKTRKHERKSYIYYLRCLLLEPKHTRSEQIESEACKEIETLVPVCYKYLINHKELDELEELLFMSEQDSLMKHEERACFVYLNSRLSHLQYGGLNEDVYNQHVMEITELLDKYSKMQLNHTESGLEDMQIKLSDLRKKHNS